MRINISGLTNDIQTIENGYLWNTFTVLDSLLTFFGAIVLMLWYSPLLTAVDAVSVAAAGFAADGQQSGETGEEGFRSNGNFTLPNCAIAWSAFPSSNRFRRKHSMLAIFSEHIKSLAAAQCGKHRIAIRNSMNK